MILYTLFARFIVDFLISMMENELILSIIILGLLLLSLIVSIVTTILMNDDIREKTVLKSAFMAYTSTLVIIILLSYIGMFLHYPYIFYHLNGLEIMFSFSQVIIYFSIYMLPHPFYLVLIAQIIYYLTFIIYLESYHEEKPFKYKHVNYELIYE